MMVSTLFMIAFFAWGLVFSVYVTYFFLVLRNSRKKEYIKLIDELLNQPINSQELPSITVLIPAYNEEKSVFRKLQDISTYEYPKEKMEVILLDDSSTDKTCEVASRAFEMLELKGRIIRSHTRTGINALYNQAIPIVETELVFLTDADITTKKDALKKAVAIMMGFKDVGAVTAKMLPADKEASMAASIEGDYRVFYDLMSTCESAIYSTFPGYGAFVLLRKPAFSSIPINRGSSDGNLSLGVIRKNFKYLYVPHVVFYEEIAKNVREQRRQKVRRATRLIQSMFLHRDFLFNKRYGAFGTTIFPLRFGIMLVCPISFFVGLGSLFLALMLYCWPLCLSLIFVVFLFFYAAKSFGKNARIQFLPSFVFHQLYLVFGLFGSYRKMGTWKQVERLRQSPRHSLD